MFLAGHSVAMVTYCVTKMITKCSPRDRHFFDDIIVVSSDKDSDPSNSKCWKLFRAILTAAVLPGIEVKRIFIEGSVPLCSRTCFPNVG